MKLEIDFKEHKRALGPKRYIKLSSNSATNHHRLENIKYFTNGMEICHLVWAEAEFLLLFFKW